MTVFDIAARQGYAVARSIVKDLAAVPNMPLPQAWRHVLRHIGPTELKDFLGPDEEVKWKRAIDAHAQRTVFLASSSRVIAHRWRSIRGQTSFAVSSMERRASAGSAQSWPV